MVLIPGSFFQMGDTFDEGWRDELPVHTVYLSPYYIDTYEVTNQQYADALNWAYGQGTLIEVTGGGVVKKPGDTEEYCDTTTSNSYSRITWNGSTFGVTTDKQDHPIVKVSWDGSVAYCNWRSAMEGKPLCYDLSTWTCDFGVAGYRLPTEAEWEKAAGWDPVQERHFRFGEHTDGCGSKCLDGHRDNHRGSGDPFETGGYPWTTPVGYYDGTNHDGYQTQNAQSHYGSYDMSGNVWEWCHDWYLDTYYASSPRSNPTGPATSRGRVLRGGNWLSTAVGSRSADRWTYRGDLRYSYVGFRCALGGSCGNGVIEDVEECDDGGESATCDADCTLAVCGDGTINTTAGEECDDGGESATCDDDCTAVACGDENTNEAAGEECDDGGESATCDDDCTAVACGDENTNEAAGETCDDGYTEDGDGCSSSCMVETGFLCTGQPSVCQCQIDAACHDDYACTCDRCVGGVCQYPSRGYGDMDCNDAINLQDLYCVLDGFGGDFINCSFSKRGYPLD